MNKDQQRILEYLNCNAIGLNNRKSSSEIRDALNLNGGGPTNENIRDLIRGMILDHECLIGSLMYSKGYWIIENEEELKMVIDHLYGRANGVRKRADALKFNWEINDWS